MGELTKQTSVLKLRLLVRSQGRVLDLTCISSNFIETKSSSFISLSGRPGLVWSLGWLQTLYSSAWY